MACSLHPPAQAATAIWLAEAFRTRLTPDLERFCPAPAVFSRYGVYCKVQYLARID
jgi:hypothetical protein